MITRAIVEEIVSPYKVRIRIPLFDRVKNSKLSTATENLTVAVMCTVPNCYPNIHVGDVVIVGFEDNTSYRAVILGHLCKENVETFCNMKLSSLTVEGPTILDVETYIGDVVSSELQCLCGVRDNIQKQLDALSSRVSYLEELQENTV